MESKGLLKSPELYKPNNHPPGKLHNSRSPKKLSFPSIPLHPTLFLLLWALMGMAPDAGQMMTLLLQLVDAKKMIEVGVFTGYSLLLTALTIPDDGKIIGVDVNRDTYEIGLPIIKKAGVEHKINFIQFEALPVLDKLLENSENEGSFDFAIVDADKINYLNYHERMMKLLKVGGVVVYYNTLWGGSVAMPEECVPEYMKDGRHFTIELNKAVAADHRIQISHTPLGDGMTICRRRI